MFDYPDARGLLVIVGKTSVVYFVLIAGLRLLGKRELGQMNIYDLVLIIILGNAVQNAMLNNDNTLGGGIASALTLLVLNYGFGALIRRSKAVEHAMVGQATLILNKGKIIKSAMNREGITEEMLMQGLREHGLESPEEAKMAILEVDGSISVVPNGSEVHHTRRRFKAFRLP